MKKIEDIAELKRMANRIRQDIVRMMGDGGAGDAGAALSATDLITALFFNHLEHDPARPDWPQRDRLIHSKGHAALALYCAYAEGGHLPRELLPALLKPGSAFQGRPQKSLLPILEASSLALGNGLSLGLGAALAGRLEQLDYRVYVVLGTGEIQEDQMWEAAGSAGSHQADTLCVLVDYDENRLDQWFRRILKLEPVEDRLRSLKWHTTTVDGHDLRQVLDALHEARRTKGQPTCIIAHTVHGKGVSFLENSGAVTRAAPTPELVKQALEELEREAAIG